MRVYYLILVSALTQFSAIGVVTLVISSLQAVEPEGSYSSIAAIVNTIGLTITGLIFGGIISKYKGVRIGRWSPVLAAIFCSPLLFNSGVITHYIVILSISILMAIDAPNNSYALNKLITDKKKKSYIFSKYQVWSQAIVLLAPLFASVSIVNFGTQITLIALISTYCISALPWSFIKIDNQGAKNQSTQKKFYGFGIIGRSPNQISMILYRIALNVIFAGAFAALPLMISEIYKANDSFTSFYGICTALISGGFVVSGYVFTKLLQHSPMTMSSFSYMSTAAPVLGILVFLFIGLTNISVLIFSMVLGLGQYFGRIVGMSYGQAITDEDDMAVIISSADTIVRAFTSVYLVVLVWMLNYFNSMLPYYIASIICSFAPLALIEIKKIYIRQVS